MKYTNEQLELKAHIEAEATKFTFEAVAAGATMIMTPSSDLDMWAEYGVYNIEQYTRASLEGEISDMEKELYGIKLRRDLSGLTIEQLQQELDSLYAYARREVEFAQELEQKRKAQVQARNNEFEAGANAMAQAFSKVL
ncbi:MAG: hypothetical protein CMF61_03345 [Magnetococcales bacterium]|nr:hypothetical protein [Magnetococcales bacterium]